MPVADLIEHDTNLDCICDPRLETGDGGNIWVHHSLDGREQHEEDQ
jgi:hypothetical protein